MKQELDRQMDSLLRGTRGGGAGRARASEHLTPDELNAYAENALPSHARAHYAAHLADCTDCRRVVTALALAAQPEPALEEKASLAAAAAGAHAAGAGWLSRLAAFFSPRVLAYAAPVLAVAIVGALAVVVLRGRGEREGNSTQQVAQQPAASDVKRPESIVAEPQPASPQANTTAAPGAGGGPANLSVAPGVGAGVGHAGPAPAADETTATPADAPRELKQAEAAPAQQPKDFTTDGVSETAVVTMPKAGPPQKAANEPPPATAAAPAPIARDELAKEDDATARAPKTEVESAKRAGEDQRQLNDRADLDENRTAARARPARRGSGGEADRGRANERNVAGLSTLSKRKGEDREEQNAPPPASSASRYAAGHEFRRRGDEWVDVDYRPSMATSNYRRGSESFRALVDDHPIIGRIAAEIPGPFVFVIGDRAYRIQ